jgi:hypothetical protein
MKILSLMALLLMLATKVNAYSVFSLKPINWKNVKSVDLFVAGYGEELGLQFLYSAVTKAQVHDDLYPDSRAQLILWAKEDGKEEDKRALQARGFTVDTVNRRKLSHNVIENYLRKLPSIASFHIFSHNSANDGNAIQKGSRLGPSNFPWSELTSNFTPESYVIFHGCNTGFLIAPAVSKLLKRPVLGSMTSTDFQEIWNGSWYHNNSGQYPANVSKAKSTNLLYDQTKSCWKGYCHRLMSNNHPYRGHWGRYEVGLPFYKSFCSYNPSSQSQKASCLKGIAKAIEAWPTIRATSWQDKVEDFICPRFAGKTTHARCLATLRGENSQKFFWGNTMNCNLEKCQFGSQKVRIEGRRVRSFTGSDAGLAPFQKEFSFLMELEQYL